MDDDDAENTEVVFNWNFSRTKDHRMIEVVRDIWRSSGPLPLLKHCQLEQTIKEDILVDF